MPFESKAQQRYLYANEPEVAKEFASKTHNISALPERKPGPRSQSTSLKGSVKDLVKAVSTRNQVKRAMDSNMSKRQYSQQQKKKRREAAIERRLNQKRG